VLGEPSKGRSRSKVSKPVRLSATGSLRSSVVIWGTSTVEGMLTMDVTPPAGDGTSRTVMWWRVASRPTTMKPRLRARVRPSSGGRVRRALASDSWSADMPMPWSVMEIV
jgi:hypothetical protein